MTGLNCYIIDSSSLIELNHKYTLTDLSAKGPDITKFIKSEIETILNNTSFLNIKLVNELYLDVLNISLPQKIWDFSIDIEKRHMIFHRNGYDVNKNQINIEKKELDSLIYRTEELISSIEKMIKKSL